MEYSAVILAAGKGVRMKSELPKVLHQAAGKPLVNYVIDAVRGAGVSDITLVLGHGRAEVEKMLQDTGIKFALQEQQLGTGHALMQARDLVKPADIMLVLAGDTPLLQAETLKNLLEFHRQKQAAATVLSCEFNNPRGYGRIVRQADGSLARIVEEKDASPQEKALREINSGMYCFQAGTAFEALTRIKANNAQGEYYLTDILEILINDGQKVEIMRIEDETEIYGINNRVQLAYAEKILRQRKNRDLMLNGVTIMDPETTYIDQDVIIGSDTLILPSTIIEGRTRIGSGCEIGPFTHINDSQLGNRVTVENSRIKEARVGDGCTIGPFAYLRPQAELADGVKVGDFVEIKKSYIGAGSKIPHLSYVGDATLGKGVNVGAGTITCNYDGKNKHQTILEDGVFIGSNTNLVAPVTIGENSVTGAGSTISRNVPANTLAVERAEQKHLKKRK
ncbi:bifunctional UDP-N-acetylglucosamine diphosphorylase/glucosamine-1-phosphate N-acetyltransferase GlmU [Syntrophomonas palmitatica]|uniref:bifunctional UDP-N-acetylglucosamine diphosphorylase/glucosamine-1-phosphate N-acetyltransferase GlmU n=1 Tax=Syntrophomonas palmitatica TaxID=402877 RepID=UPI0006D13C20|nr:bifunctional UDP-N-acetylglucosamine diphosphorylase/glucosamine-1-phosphate N-acetyltransferase GlmU [Syntrophomonas palmitatica]